MQDKSKRAELMKSQGSREIWIGVRDALPLMLGLLPFGITCGILALAAGLTGVEAVMMSLLVYAGAAQFISISMLAAGVSDWTIITLTTLLINLRHLLMGASMAPYMLKLPVPVQAFLTFGLTDESFALNTAYISGKAYSPYYQAGSQTALYLMWSVSTTIGVLLGAYITDPLAWGIDFAMPAIFLALLIPRLVDRTSLIVCFVSAVLALLGNLYLPGKWYIIIACAAACLVGGLLKGGERDAA
ncbi:MAG: AzlC family ABC transporter permease [Ignavibacteriales bacterium]